MIHRFKIVDTNIVKVDENFSGTDSDIYEFESQKLFEDNTPEDIFDGGVSRTLLESNHNELYQMLVSCSQIHEIL